MNYTLDGIEYGTDATEYLLKTYDLLYKINNNIKRNIFAGLKEKGK
jgi:hypothetical protein